MADATERTFIMVKPDGVQRGIVGEILRRFEQRGYKLVGLKLLQVKHRKISSRCFSSASSSSSRHHELYSKVIMKNTKV